MLPLEYRGNNMHLDHLHHRPDGPRFDAAASAAQPPCPVAAGLAALERGAAFVEVRASRSAPAYQVHPDLRDRLVGNWFSELNSLLHVVLNHACVARGLTPSPRTSQTARKLRLAIGAWPDEFDDTRRFRGLARSTACLRYERGIARYPDALRRDVMTLGWGSAGQGRLKVARLGTQMSPSGAEIATVARFYRAVGVLVQQAMADGVTAGPAGPDRAMPAPRSAMLPG